MRRREFISLLCAAAPWPCAAWAPRNVYLDPALVKRVFAKMAEA
jgi:hypothetical protein